MYKITVYIPESHLEPVKSAMFSAGAGTIGHYHCCAWQVLGTGQFTPGAQSTPYLGTADTLEYVEEYRVEMVCQEDKIRSVIKAMHNAHPYETPAYDVIRCETIE
jgi:hypothetical protein